MKIKSIILITLVCFLIGFIFKTCKSSNNKNITEGDLEFSFSLPNKKWKKCGIYKSATILTIMNYDTKSLQGFHAYSYGKKKCYLYVLTGLNFSSKPDHNFNFQQTRYEDIEDQLSDTLYNCYSGKMIRNNRIVEIGLLFQAPMGPGSFLTEKEMNNINNDFNNIIESCDFSGLDDPDFSKITEHLKKDRKPYTEIDNQLGFSFTVPCKNWSKENERVTNNVASMIGYTKDILESHSLLGYKNKDCFIYMIKEKQTQDTNNIMELPDLFKLSSKKSTFESNGILYRKNTMQFQKNYGISYKLISYETLRNNKRIAFFLIYRLSDINTQELRQELQYEIQELVKSCKY